ncbi:acyl-CoA dehydrogenase/oxidase [Lasiosphaeris hirsuta]|uniref:Acyl-CoA dehydrogenase/oxidase n=1 Tax=Lasiosphaeris hirsuta TaxID=260670 RepID=A0AA40E449_9PEZI|nr:acyl-CoA dehydrogenase/oxidase [Lasiosphaeris hirsuta]
MADNIQAQVHPSSDPAVYQEFEAKWATLPTDAEGWIQRARDVGAVLGADAAEREKANKSPKAEVALLKHSGLTKVLGLAKYGGGGQPWSVGYKAIREVAKADGSIGMLLGYHLLWSTTANVVGSAEQADRFQKLILENNYFIGGAVNPRDNDLKITYDDEKFTYNGFKHFNTGGVVSDLTVLEGAIDGRPEEHIFAFVPTAQTGIQFLHNWDNVGLRLTESGSVKIENVSAPWADALGWDAEKKPDLAWLGINFGSLLLPTIQLVFINFYLGIAHGALDFAKSYTVKNTRAWPFGGDNKDSPTDEFYILATYGNFFAHLRAAETLVDRAGAEADILYNKYGSSADGSARAGLTPRERGEWAEWVASAKVVTTDTGLRVTAGVFEVTGSRATASKVGLDRFWRDLRVHTLHDPVAYKNREVGRYLLLDEVPEPTWYT